MEITLLKAKIHRAVVTQADLDYVGSITIDSELMVAAGIMEYERVEIADVDNGNRFATYVIAGDPGSGVICVNGAAAHHPKVVFVDEENHVTRQANYERHGLLCDQE